MKFNELNELIPYAKGGKEKSLSIEPYPNIKLLLPGRHALDTIPVGGDFCVCVTDPAFPAPDHQFTHTDIFKDVEIRHSIDAHEGFMRDYYKIITGGDPDLSVFWPTPAGCIETQIFLHAAQCLAVAEHRRYAKYEAKFGGRYLPFRFAAGIAEGLWTAADAANLQKKGRPGVEILERQYGTPALTKELME